MPEGLKDYGIKTGEFPVRILINDAQMRKAIILPNQTASFKTQGLFLHFTENNTGIISSTFCNIQNSGLWLQFNATVTASVIC